MMTQTNLENRIGVFAQGQILCISPNGLQAGHCDAPPPPTPFWMTENEFLAISDQYTTFYLFYFFFTKWLPAAILDDRKSLSITFRHFRSILNFWMTENHLRSHFSPFQINTQPLLIFYFVHKMAAGGHFGCPKITFDRISRHFRSIRNFFC